MSSFSRKVTSAVSVLAITLSAVGTSLTAFAANSEFLPYADALATAGIIKKQDAEAGYRLGDKITRAEMAKIAANIAELDAKECTGKIYSDVTTSLGDLCGYIEAAADAGFVSKTNAKFRPLDLITRAETVKMLLGAKGIASSDVAAGYKDVDAKLGDLAGYINAAAAEGIVAGSDKNAYFRPNDTSSRGEAFKIAANSAGLSVGDDLGDLDDLFGDDTDTGSTSTGSTSTGSTSTGSTVVVATGDLEVSLGASSPASQTVPRGTAVPFAKLDFTAGSSDAQFSSVTITRQGLGSKSDFDKVWLEKDGARATSRQSITTDDKATLTFFPALVVKAGSTVSMTLIGRYKSTAATNVTNNFSILSASDIVAGGTVKGTFPIVSGGMTTSGYNTLPVKYRSTNSSATATNLTSTYKVGDKAVELAQFELTAQGDSNTRDRDVIFKGISLKNDGNSKISTGLANLALYAGSTKVSTSTSVDGEVVTFAVGSGVTIKYGNTETFYVRGDLVGLDSSTSDTYAFTTKYEEDVNVVEANTGFGSRIYTDMTAATFTSLTNGYYQVDGGKITFARSTDAPNTKTIAKGAKEVVLLKADVYVKEAVQIQGARFTLTSAQRYGDAYSTFKLKLGDSVVATFTPDSDTGSTLDFDSSFDITKDTTLSVVADVKSNAITTLNAFKVGTLNFATLNVYGAPEYISNGNKLTSADIVGSVEGANVTINDPTLTVTRNDGIQDSKTLISGSKAVKVAGYTIKASDVDSLTIQKIKFTVAGTGANYNASLITNAKLMVGGTQVGDLSDFEGGNAEWNNLSIAIAKNAQIQLDLYVDFSTSFSTAAANLIFTFKGNDMSVRDSSSNTLTLSGLEKTSSNFFVTTGGSVQVASNSNTPSSSVAPASLTEKEVARFTLGATDDKIKITDFYLINATPMAAGAAYTTAGTYLVKSGTTVANFTRTYGDTAGNRVGTFSVAGSVVDAGTIYAIDANLGSRVNAISLYKLDGTKIADGSISDAVVSFNMGDSSTFVVDANNNDYTVVVKAKFNSITTASQSGKFVSLNAGVTPAGAVSSSINGMRVLSDSTGLALSENVKGFASSNPTLLTKSIATVAKTTDSRLATKLAVGAQKVYAVQVTADAAGSIDLAKLTTNITLASGVTLDTANAKLYDAADLRIAGTATVASTGGLVTFDNLAETISAGTSKTYLIEVTVAGTITTGSSIAVSLVTDSGFSGPLAKSGLTGANFIWSDRSDASHSALSTDYYNGYKVNGLEGAGSNTISY